MSLSIYTQFHPWGFPAFDCDECGIMVLAGSNYITIRMVGSGEEKDGQNFVLHKECAKLVEERLAYIVDRTRKT